VVDNKKYQDLGIDAIVLYQIDGVVYAKTIDVKTDDRLHTTGNVFLETKTAQKDGNFVSSGAEFFVIYDRKDNVIYNIPLYPLKKFIESNPEIISNHVTSEPVDVEDGNQIISEGDLISLSTLLLNNLAFPENCLVNPDEYFPEIIIK